MRADVLSKLARKSLQTSPCVLATLSTLFVLLVADFMSVYSLYYYKLRDNPGFAYTRDRGGATTAVLAITIVLLIGYYLWFLLALICNARLILRQEKSQVALALFSLAVHLLAICSFLLGRYSQHFANGGLQCFLIGFLNLYVYLLCFINYPVFARKPFEPIVESSNDTVEINEIELQDFQ